MPEASTLGLAYATQTWGVDGGLRDRPVAAVARHNPTARTNPAPHPDPPNHPATPHTPDPPPAPPPGTAQQPSVAELLARLGSPFTTEEVAAHADRTKQRKAVAGELPPWFLKAAAGQVAPLLAATFNAWQRVGRLPTSAALSIIQPILKPGGDPTSCSSLRGIALTTLAAKLYATILERRISDWAEASGNRAAGQYGFRRKRSTAQAAFVLRTLQDQHRIQHQQLWACFVDFKQAYDSVPRERLWGRLQERGLDAGWLRAAQALYEDVPMSVRTPAGLSPSFQALRGLKQGCPLSPTLFGLYIDSLEGELGAAARRGEQTDQPTFLAGSTTAVPPLLYADDLTLLATTPAGLQRQLLILQGYCRQLGLTVNTAKTKVMLLSGARTVPASRQLAEAAGLLFAGQPVPTVTEFKFLGITFHSTTNMAGAACPARTQLARLALSNTRARCAELGVEAAPVHLRLFSMMVDSVLSHGAEVWGVQLVARAAASPEGAAGSAAERLQMGFLRGLLGVRQAAPNAVVLAETGEAPLWRR